MAQAVPAAERERILAELLVRRAAGETFAAIAATPGWASRPTLRKWLRRRPDLHVPPLREPSVRWSQGLADALASCWPSPKDEGGAPGPTAWAEQVAPGGRGRLSGPPGVTRHQRAAN